jgi:hypothetical protein
LQSGGHAQVNASNQKPQPRGLIETSQYTGFAFASAWEYACVMLRTRLKLPEVGLTDITCLSKNVRLKTFSLPTSMQELCQTQLDNFSATRKRALRDLGFARISSSPGLTG